MELTFTLGCMTIKMKFDGETVEEAADLASKVFTWMYQTPVELFIMDEEDDNLYIEPNPPRDNIQHEGM